MNSWSLDSLQLHVGRKVVPEGSNDFQRVLDEICCGDEAHSPCDQCLSNSEAECVILSQENYMQEDHTLSLTSDVDEVRMICQCLRSKTYESDNNNNNTSTRNRHLNSCICDTSCAIEQCQQYKQVQEQQTCYFKYPTNVVFSDAVENSLIIRQIENTASQKCSVQQLDSVATMGANCSSNIYDHREWHSVKGENTHDSVKPKKRGRLLKKLVSSQRFSDNNQVPSDTSICICEQQDSNILDKEPPLRPLDFQTNGLKGTNEKRTSLSPEDISLTYGQQLTSNRLSPNVDSSGHVQLSRVVGSGRARATANCDVSPHRLLTRRNNSPSGRSPGLDTKSLYEERQRSHSWSNGKLGNKANFKTSSLTVRSSNPVKNLKTGSAYLVPDRSSKLSPVSAAKTQSKLSKTEVHAPECPLHIKKEDTPKISVSKSAEAEQDTDLVPVLRRRAASESQTLRPRRLLPRTPESCDQIQEHAHVRWADEEHGSSLSTSVFLSSIRPRSYSYGAMDNVPHRPILKKVAGF